VLYAIPYWVPRLAARSADQDAASTYKLAAGLVVYPIWMAGLVGASIAFVPPPWKIPAVAVAVLSPFAALAWLDAWKDRAGHRSITDGDRARLAQLRAGAMAAIADARASVSATLG
jgi:hypothetical protein